MNKWKSMTFSDAVAINPRVPLIRGEIYPFIEMSTVNSSFRYVSEGKLRQYSGNGSRFQCGDTLMARITPCLENGKIAQYSESKSWQIGYGSTEFIVLRGKNNITDSSFVYYLARSDKVRDYAISQMTGTSGRQRVPTESLKHLSVAIPPLPEQRAIAAVLGALDDKIELNRRMNETLEAMARAVFEDWFVHFGPTRAKMEGREPRLAPELSALFPDRIDDRTGLPEGWKPALLGDVATSENRAVDPAEAAHDMPYIGLEHMPRGSIALSQWASATSVTSQKTRFEKGEFLFGKLRPYFHKVGIAPVDGICSTDIIVIRPVSEEWSAFVLASVSSERIVDFADRTSTGTRMPRTSWKALSRYELALPPSPLAAAYREAVGPMLDGITANIRESHALATARDNLLPRLLSGAIRPHDVEEAGA